MPEARQLPPEEWAALERIVEAALAERPPALWRQLALFLLVLEWAPLLRWGRRLSALDPERRTRFLEAVQAAPLLLLRRGFWGLRTLVFLGYYGRPAAAGEIGYRADPRGWALR